MESPYAAMEPLLANSMRVLRNKNTAQQLIAAYPSLKAKSLASPPTLTEYERRMLLDLPDEDEEASNIAAATSLTRSELIEKAVSNGSSLTQEEVVLLADRFWSPSSEQEVWKYCLAQDGVDKEVLDESEAVRAPVYFESEAITVGLKESWEREKALRNAEHRIKAEPALPYAKEWIQYLYKKDKDNWGFICLYDAAAQQIDPNRLLAFERRLDDFFQHALLYNGSRDILDLKWATIQFNAPNTAFAPTNDAPETMINQSGAIFRKAFRDILEDANEYQNAEDVIFTSEFGNYNKDFAGRGILANTFLVIDPVCIDSVLEGRRMYDDMRILAFEADFPIEGQQYAEGYQGFTWVRMDQLVYNFYELRSMRADEVGMDEIWRAAQGSMHGAFVSMDPDETWNWSESREMIGFTRDSVMGSRWYEMKEAREEKERSEQMPRNHH